MKMTTGYDFLFCKEGCANMKTKVRRESTTIGE